MRDLYEAWIEAKRKEKESQEARREIEDKIIAKLELDTRIEGVINIDHDGIKAKITPKMTRRVNSEVLDAIIQEQGMMDAAKVLFRWKPELNLTAWKQADSSITDKFADAITTKPARATFSITEV